VDFLFRLGWRRGTGWGPKLRKTGDQRIQNSGAQGKEVEFAFARDLDKTRGLEFLDVVGKGGGGNGQRRPEDRTAHRAGRLGNPLQQFESLGVGEGFEDPGAAGTGETNGLGGSGGGRG